MTDAAGSPVTANVDRVQGTAGNVFAALHSFDPSGNLQSYDEGGLQWVGSHDELGGASDITGQGTSVLSRSYDYTPYGSARAAVNSFGTGGKPARLRFAGMLQNSEVSGAYLAGVRMYDSSVGRFTSVDPIGHRVGEPFESPYAYAGNAPTANIDRTGLCAVAPWADDSCTSQLAASVPGGETLDNVLTGVVAVGDVVTGGLSQSVRHAIGLGGAVNECSAAYRTTSTVAAVATVALGGVGVARFAVTKAFQLPGLAARAATSVPKAIATVRASATVSKATTTTRLWAAGRAEKVKDITSALGARVRLADDTGTIDFAATTRAAEAAAASRGLSSVGNQNVRVLRNWANSKGWVRQSGEGPEVWGIRGTDGSFSWRLKIKPEASTRPGLEAGSKVPRFDARLGPGRYVNPFNGEVGGRPAGTHVPLEYPWIP